MGNVILLTIDALRKDAVGCYGGIDPTPNLDSLARSGIQFSKACSTGPYTQAAFPGVLTSSYYLQYNRQKRLSEKRVLISEVLRKADVETAAFHCNAYMSDFFGWNRGWNIFYDSMDEEVVEELPYIKAQALNQKAADWLRSRSNDERAFFLWMHYMDVHEPYVPEKEHIRTIDGSLSLSKSQMMALFKDVLLKRDVSDREAVGLLKKLYRAHVREVDEATGHLLGLLGQLGVLEYTTIIVTSDHGDEFGEHGGLSHDGKMFAELIDVPLIISTPKSGADSICDKVVSTVDLPPTIAHLFGVEPYPSWQGYPLLPLDGYLEKGAYGEALDKKGSRELGQEGPIYYLREDDLKIIYHAPADSWQLYDLSQDPGEERDIIHMSTRTEEMKAKLRERIHMTSV